MTKQEAKEWTKKLFHRIETQDNRCTANPLQFLLQRRRSMVVDGDYKYDEIVYYHIDLERDGFETREECIEALSEYGYEGRELERKVSEIEKLYIAYYWETDQAFLTEEGVQRHISLNRHNLGPHRDYVVHAFRNPEMQELFEALKALTEEE